MKSTVAGLHRRHYISFYVNEVAPQGRSEKLLVLFSFCAIRLLPSINRIINHFTYLRFFTPTAELMFEEIYLNKKKIIDEKNKNHVTINDFTKSILLKD